MEKIRILGIERKLSKDGTKTYFSVKTDKGNMMCWDAAIAEGLLKLELNTQVDVEIQESGGFKNIRKVEPCNQEPEPTYEKIQQKTFLPKDTSSMYASYAKDLFLMMQPKIWENAGDKEREQLSNEQIMAECIKLVKQVKTAFEGA
jgi:hypothetical protein